MPKRRIKPHEKKSFIKKTLEERSSVQTLTDDFFVISLKHFDKVQGDRFSDWDDQAILARAIETLEGYSHAALRTQTGNDKFTIYGDFPPAGKTDFSHPTHVPEDAEWARIHVTGKQCIVGHVVQNTFYIVFLDGNHSFWKSELKNT